MSSPGGGLPAGAADKIGLKKWRAKASHNVFQTAYAHDHFKKRTGGLAFL
jgi:hypothetical protein